MPSLEGYKSSLEYSYAPGVFPAMECMLCRPERVRRLLIHSSAAGREGVGKLISLAGELGVRIEEADRALARISGKDNCYAAAVFEKFSDRLVPGKPHVVLYQPGDSGNVGTIIRTALGLGLEDLAIIRPCADPFDPKTVRASMGSLFGLRIHVYECFDDYRGEFPEQRLYPFMLDASVPLKDAVRSDIPEAYSLVFGNEGSGLPPEFAGYGQPVRIESNEKVDSLNLAIAAGIAMYAFSIGRR